MAGRQDISAGRAYVSLYVNQSALVKGLRSASRQLQSFGMGIAKIGGSMMAAGGAVLGPLVAMAREFANAGSALFDMSGRTGVSVEKLQTLGYAAQMTGLDMAGLEGAIRRMQKNGFSVDQMGAIADKLAAIEDPTKRAQEAMKIFGKTGTSMLPMLAGGAKGLAEFQATAERLGLVLSTEDAAAADTLGDAIDTLWGSLKGVRNQIGAALAPTLTKLATTLVENLVRVIAWVKANREMVLSIAKVAAIVVGVGAAITGLGMAFMAAGMALGGFASVIGLIGSALGFLLSPLGLVLAGIAVGTAAFITFTETGQWLASTLMSDFGTAFDTVKQTIGGITDALKAGEFKLAGEIAMTGLTLAFQEGTNNIRGVWLGFNKWVVDVFTQAMKAIIGWAQWLANKLNEAWGGIQVSGRWLFTRGKGEEDNADIFEARNKTAESINTIIGDWSKGLDEFGKGVDENLTAKLTEGEARIKALRDELSKLIGVAATRLAALPSTPPPVARTAATGDLGTAQKDMVAATFSSAALVALGQGGGPMKELVEIGRKQLQEMRRQVAAIRNSGRTIAEQMAALLAIQP